jgi:hypothetical protein
MTHHRRTAAALKAHEPVSRSLRDAEIDAAETRDRWKQR